MKRFLLKITTFFIVMVVIDIASDRCFEWLRCKARNGQTCKNEYVSKDFNDDILILGSSRAVHHYIPNIIEDSLKMTCYNAGEEGCGIITAYMRFKMARAISKPRIIIYEVTPGFDFYNSGDYSTYLGVIRQYADRKEIKDIYLDFCDKLEELRLISGMYRNNSKIIKNVKDVLSSIDDKKGYEPLYGEMKHSIKYGQLQNLSENELQIDSLKYELMKHFITEVKNDGIILILSISPIYNEKMVDLDYKLAHQLADIYNVPILDNRKSLELQLSNNYFQDMTHLNNRGAVIYSNFVSKQIKSLLY